MPTLPKHNILDQVDDIAAFSKRNFVDFDMPLEMEAKHMKLTTLMQLAIAMRDGMLYEEVSSTKCNETLNDFLSVMGYMPRTSLSYLAMAIDIITYMQANGCTDAEILELFTTLVGAERATEAGAKDWACYFDYCDVLLHWMGVMPRNVAVDKI